ncbi:MAG: cation transporter [Oscillospiraceae bacterium]|nr:cation transporter [Oscillospiraceae bacterium]
MSLNDTPPKPDSVPNHAKSGARTLLASLILSSPGPLVVGIGLFLGKSSTQLADFIRRTAELLAILVSFIIYRITHKDETFDPARNLSLEKLANRSVGIAMCVSGLAMLLVALLFPSGEKGNVIPGLIIAILGVITNTWFFFRYRKLDHAHANAILAAQSGLYRAKSLVDTCVMISLIVVAIAPASQAAYYFDIIGSVIVSLYLVVTGIGILRGKGRITTSMTS